MTWATVTTPDAARPRSWMAEQPARWSIERVAHASLGWTSSIVVFELVDHDELNMVAAYGGFPTRYPHWRFGMDYDQLAKSYTYGLSKIYELVINNDPCYAYLMRSNSMVTRSWSWRTCTGTRTSSRTTSGSARTNRKMMDHHGQPRHARAALHRRHGH